MKDFKYKYEHLTYTEFFEELNKVGNNSQKERLVRVMMYEDDFNHLSFEKLVDIKILLKQFKPLKDDLKNKVSEWKEAIQIALDNKRD